MLVEPINITDREAWLSARRDSFEKKFIPEPNSGCWIWIAASSGGYGYFYWRPLRRPVHAQRAAWFLYAGSLRDDQHVCHRCDLRLCVNPDHLFADSNAANIADRCAKGRSAHVRGNTNGRAKLTDKEVLAILCDPRPHRVIAQQYGISTGPVGKIKTGQAWTHITKDRGDDVG